MANPSATGKTAGSPMSRAPAQRRAGPPDKTATTDPDQRHEIWCDIQRSIRYHRARETFFQFYANLISFVTFLGGSGVVVLLLGNAPEALAILAGALVAASQGADLVFRVHDMARLHAALASEFLFLDRMLARDTDLAILQTELLALEAREPPIKRYLDLICHNQVAVMIGSNDTAPLTFWQSHLANWRSGNQALQ